MPPSAEPQLTEAELALKEKREKILNRVRALIAKADDLAQREPGESELCREKADELMEQFAIEMWQVEAASELTSARRPIGRMMSLSWMRGHPYQGDVWTLYTATAYHCRCVVASWKWHNGEIGVVGLEADIDYFNIVFTHLLAEMGRRLVPSIDPNQSAEWNAWSLRSKHIGWPEIAYRLSKAGMLAWPAGYENRSYSSIAEHDLPTAQAWRRKARKLYRDYCRKNGIDPEPSKQPETAGKSYAKGWAQEIKRRMYAREVKREEQATGSMAVALRDIRAVVQEAVEDIYPRPVYKPVAYTEQPTRRRRAVVVREPPFDSAAYERGMRDAKDVDISGHQNRRVENNPKELEA